MLVQNHMITNMKIFLIILFLVSSPNIAKSQEVISTRKTYKIFHEISLDGQYLYSLTRSFGYEVEITNLYEGRPDTIDFQDIGYKSDWISFTYFVRSFDRMGFISYGKSEFQLIQFLQNGEILSIDTFEIEPSITKARDMFRAFKVSGDTLFIEMSLNNACLMYINGEEVKSTPEYPNGLKNYRINKSTGELISLDNIIEDNSWLDISKFTGWDMIGDVFITNHHINSTFYEVDFENKIFKESFFHLFRSRKFFDGERYGEVINSDGMFEVVKYNR